MRRGLAAADVDSGGYPVRVVLSAPEGSGVLEDRAAENVEAGGSGTNRVTLSGTVANVNVVLDGLRFLSAPNTSGNVTLTVSTGDLGNTGSGGELTDEDTLTITFDADCGEVFGPAAVASARVADDQHCTPAEARYGECDDGVTIMSSRRSRAGRLRPASERRERRRSRRRRSPECRPR